MVAGDAAGADSSPLFVRYTEPMLLKPNPSALPRLDVPQKGWAWKAWYALQAPKRRRTELSRLIHVYDMEEGERLSRMRTLIDIGLWGDLKAGNRQDEREFGYEHRGIGMDVMYSTRNGLCTPGMLHLALEAGLDPNWCENNRESDTLATMLAKEGLVSCLKIALDAGADPTQQTTLHRAVLDILLENASEIREDRQGYLTAVEDLLSRGVDINSPGAPRKNSFNDHRRPPITRVIHVRDQELVEWMIGRGARLDVIDAGGNTALHWAASVDESWNEWTAGDFFDLLLENGAPLDAPNNCGQTPLWCALNCRNPNAARWLLGRGADPHVVPHTLVDSEGYEKPGKPDKSPLQLLCENIHFSEKTIDLAYALSPRGMEDWNVKTPSGKSLYKVLEKKGSPWLASAQAASLHQSAEEIQPTPLPTSPRPRL